jgi:murein DD-endopeptidase MepM/ murein hydrolase activator NlpD
LVEGGAPPPEPPSITVTIEPGQTLSRIAIDHHVPMQAIAAANHLSPPYRIIAGATLIIPGGGTAVAAGPPEPPSPPAAAAGSPPPKPVAVAELPPPKSLMPPPAKPEAAPRRPVAALPHPAEPEPARAIPLDRPPPPAAKPEPATPTKLAALPPAEKHALPPPPTEENALAPPPAAKSKAAVAPAPARDKPVAAPPPTKHDGKPAAAPAHGGNFLWPVRGHVLESFGSGPGGTHNDGINIAAPRGAAVEAADGGVVAYAGNELRGYGNLILVKHPNGWITAYAHCDMMLVKPGQKVAKGQVIARVGATGNVGEPQLHFELRRGNKPVDPREYLAPLPSADAKEPRSG